MQCANCERPTIETAVFGNHCGIRLVEAYRNCNSHNPLGSKFCHVCGSQLSDAPRENYEQEKSSAAQLPTRDEAPIPNRALKNSPPGTSVGNITKDLKELTRATQKLATDVVAYSAPRIRTLSKKVKTLAETAVVASIA